MMEGDACMPLGQRCFLLSFVSEQTLFLLRRIISAVTQQLSWVSLYKGMIMKKLTSMTLISAMMIGTFAMTVSAATHYANQYNESELKSMDTNNDNMVSKDEFLAYSEMAFSKMKLTNGMISLKNKNNSSETDNHDYESSLNDKPIGTTKDNPRVNKRDAVNGKKY